MRFPLQARYAICAVFDMAYNGHGELLQAKVISERQGVPTRYLEQILRRLRRAGLVASRRGPGGGHTLARAPADISVREVVEAVVGPLDDVFESAQSANAFRPDFLWPQLTAGVAAALDATSIEALCRDAAVADVERADPGAPMYFI